MHPTLAASTTQLGNFFLTSISTLFLRPPAVPLDLISIFHLLASLGVSPFPVMDILETSCCALRSYLNFPSSCIIRRFTFSCDGYSCSHSSGPNKTSIFGFVHRKFLPCDTD